MRRVEATGYGKRILYVYRHPMPEHHGGFVEVVSKLYIPRREISEEESTARFEHPYALSHPPLAPLEVLMILQRVVDPVTVVLA
jgi:hypothetical protein